MIDEAELDSIQPALTTEDILKNGGIGEAEYRGVDFHAENTDGQLVRVRLEPAVRRCKRPSLAAFDVQTEGLGIAALKQAVAGARVNAGE